MKTEVIYTIEERIGVLSKDNRSSYEVNIVNWNNTKPKIDLRKWYEVDGETRPAKGITMTTDEAKVLVALLTEYLKGVE